MIRGKDNVMEWVKSTPGIKQVQVRTAPGADAFLFQSDEGENKKTIEDRLSRTLDYLEPGKYYIEMSDGNSRRNWYREFFILEGDAASVPTLSGPSMSGVSPEEVDRRIAAALDAQKKEFRIAELEAKVAEYEDELEERQTPIQEAIGRVTPYLPAILERFFPKTVCKLVWPVHLSRFGLTRNPILTITAGYCELPNGWLQSSRIISICSKNFATNWKRIPPCWA